MLLQFILEWKNEWSSGNNTIDEQHKKLIKMTNELLDMSFSIIYSEKIISHFDILLECLINHFAYEEKFIFDSGYPDFDKHVKEHKQLYEKALQFKETCKTGQLKYSDCFEILVDDIIIGHIINEDIKIFPIYQENLILLKIKKDSLHTMEIILLFCL